MEQAETIGIGTEPKINYEKLTEKEIERIMSELLKQFGCIPPNDLMRHLSASMLKKNIRWIREIENPMYFSQKEYLAMLNVIERYESFPVFFKKWDLYRKLSGISSTLDMMNASLSVKGDGKKAKKKRDKKIQEAKAGKSSKEFDEITKINNAVATIVELMTCTISIRFHALYYKQQENRPVSPSLDEIKKIKIKEVQKAAKTLNIKLKGKDIYLMKKIFKTNN